MDFEKIKKDFPILKQKVNGKRIVYLDNGATSQKPLQVLRTMDEFYEEYNSNIHRGVYKFSEQATEAYEKSREILRHFLNANGEVIFTKNATEAMNLIAYAWGEKNIKKGDKIVATVMEHHSNFVPWQQLAKRKNAKLELIDIDSDYELNEKELDKIKGAKLVAVTHTSNVLGTINNVAEICKIATDSGAISVIDGAQSAPHMEVDLKKIKSDFFVLTGHKMLGPTGIGAICGNHDILEEMEPFLFGGEMVTEVYNEKSVWNKLPYKFEGGTPNIAGVIGLGSAIDYLQKIGMNKIRKHEIEITKYALDKLNEIKEIEVYGPEKTEKRAGIVSFNIKNIHPHDVATILDEQGIAIRSGHHCAMPLHNKLKLDATNRASFYIYNDEKDVDALVEGINAAKNVFS